MSSRFKEIAAAAITALALAAALIGSGFAICAGIPQITEALSRATCADELSPFGKDELVQAAIAARAYTIEHNDRTALFQTISAINEQSSTPYANATTDQLETAPDAYTLPPEALSHLDDVYGVTSRAIPALLGIAVLAAFCLTATFQLFGARTLGRALSWAGASVLALFATFALAAVVNFDVFFSAFHRLFFADGTWTFPTDSLLICMYPEPFWAGMGGIWLAVSIALSLASLVAGIVATRRSRGAQAHRPVQA